MKEHKKISVDMFENTVVVSANYIGSNALGRCGYKRQAPKNRRLPVTGYGGKIPTDHLLLFCGAWHRVYAMCYSNSPTLYVLHKRQTVFVEFYDWRKDN